jgi:Flp pilus assembly protein CpaB
MSLRVRILISAMTALLFGAGIYTYLINMEEKATILVAVREIKARTQITTDMVRLQTVSAKDRRLMVPNAYTSVEQVRGAVAVIDILEGEVLRQDPRFLTPRKDVPVQLAPNQRLKLSYTIPEGARAVGISVSAAASVFDRINKGDRVDVAVTGESKTGPWSMIVLYNVPVIEIAQSGSDNGSRDVVLLLSPEQSLELLAARQAGTHVRLP